MSVCWRYTGFSGSLCWCVSVSWGEICVLGRHRIFRVTIYGCFRLQRRHLIPKVSKSVCLGDTGISGSLCMSASVCWGVTSFPKSQCWCVGETLAFQGHYFYVYQFFKETLAFYDIYVYVFVLGRHHLFRVSMSVCVSLLRRQWLPRGICLCFWRTPDFKGLCIGVRHFAKETPAYQGLHGCVLGRHWHISGLHTSLYSHMIKPNQT